MRLRRAAVLCLLASSSVSGQETPAAKPSRVKAAFLRNFARYVEWPASAFVSAHAHWSVGVLGNARFCEVLEKALRGRTERDRAFEVECAESLGELQPCHILFIAIEDVERRRAVLAELKGKPVLTVGDAPGFLQEGGVVRFQLEERLQMSINLDQARSASLTIHTEMLEVAREVWEKGATSEQR